MQLSLALFEELELITALLQQYFEYADDFALSDWLRYCEIKDKILFSVVDTLFEERVISPQSTVEQ